VDWGREALEKNLGNFDLRKGFVKHTVVTKLEGRRLELVGEEDKPSAAQRTNPNQRERSDADPCPRPVSQG
jgi:hypothetical protein